MQSTDQQLERFLKTVNDDNVAFNQISGGLLSELIKRAGGSDKLGEGDHAESLRRSSAFAGTKGRCVKINQAATLFLLEKAKIDLTKREPTQARDSKPAKK